ncbi:hypothetical protein VM1G_11243 [Cytospora mali]|nr:hypothetical protein VM1G_11243 [Valsa mali]
MSVTRDVRSRSWNVEFWSGSWRLGGVRQCEDLLLVADIAYELELCLVLDKPDDNTTPWQPALLPRATTSGRLIILNQQDNSRFPTPVHSDIHCYDYLWHSSECTSREVHRLEDICIRLPDLPKRRVDPRYLEIGKVSLDERHLNYQTRNSSSKRRSTSSSRTISLSPTRTDTTDTEIPFSVPPGEGRSAIRNFRPSVFRNCTGCIFTGDGYFEGLPWPGLEAAHIVPQSQWHTYPINEKKDMANPDAGDQLGLAWRGTWSAETNGLSMMSHLHRCFNARIIAIHPKTHLVRAFVDYPVVARLHGKPAKLPRLIPSVVLQHHWDMCCLENTPSLTIIPTSGVLTNVPKLSKDKVRNTPQGDPCKDDFSTQPSDAQASSSVPASNTQASWGNPALDTQAFQLAPCQATAHPPSPPLSEPGLEDGTLWVFGKGTMKGPNPAQKLLTEVGSLINNDEESCRGRSREKRRCLATEENAEDDSYTQSRDTAKRQRHE